MRRVTLTPAYAMVVVVAVLAGTLLGFAATGLYLHGHDSAQSPAKAPPTATETTASPALRAAGADCRTLSHTDPIDRPAFLAGPDGLGLDGVGKWLGLGADQLVPLSALPRYLARPNFDPATPGVVVLEAQPGSTSSAQEANRGQTRNVVIFVDSGAVPVEWSPPDHPGYPAVLLRIIKPPGATTALEGNEWQVARVVLAGSDAACLAS
ncbi:MAG: hypothetical protein ACRD12_19645 [Acidimicrobiales bacterium]